MKCLLYGYVFTGYLNILSLAGYNQINKTKTHGFPANGKRGIVLLQRPLTLPVTNASPGKMRETSSTVLFDLQYYLTE